MRALLSVYDKAGVIELARGLVELGHEIISTGGTFQAIARVGLPVTPVSAITGFPEILDGRVKTLHPAIHGALLARRDAPAHLAALAEHQIDPIDLVAVNLYPFGDTIADPTVSLATALEHIDIGGPAMIRAAAKNFPGVIVLTDPADYEPTLNLLRQGEIDATRRRELAAKAFAHVATYDSVVAEYLGHDLLPPALALAGRKARDLRYGENPHQPAAAYHRLAAGPDHGGVLDAVQLAGKELSFNNLLDADAAWAAVSNITTPAVAIIKHTIPCGLACRDQLADAFAAALAGDPVSAFGGIVALNREVDETTARQLVEVFFEVVIAPGFAAEAIDVLGRKRQLRLLALAANQLPAPVAGPVRDVRTIAGGFLVQAADNLADDPTAWRVVTRRTPTDQEWADLRFAWHAVRHVKSNGIVLVRDQAVVGVGSGQPNRVESVRIAVAKASERAAGSVLASDAFFPFPDGLEAAAAAGVRAAVQPGGSVRDAEVIAAADGADMAMVCTGVRHFRH